MNHRVTSLVGVVAVLLGLYVYYAEMKPEEARLAAEESEKMVLAVLPEAVSSLTVEVPGGGWSALRAGDDWTLVAPVTGPADGSQVSTIVEALIGLQIERVVADSVPDLSAFGFGPSEATLSLGTPEGDRVLKIGAESPTGEFLFARTVDRPRVLLVPVAIRSTIDRDLDSVRDKQVFDLETDTIDRIAVTSSAGDAVVRREPSGEWMIEGAPERVASQSEVDSFLSRIEHLRAREFVDFPGDDLSAYGLDAPIVTVELHASSDVHRMELGQGQDRAGVEPEDPAFFLRVIGRQTPLYGVYPYLKDQLGKGPDGFRVSQVFRDQVVRDEMQSITLLRGDRALELARIDDPEDWMVGQKAADYAPIRRLISSLQYLRFSSFERDDVSDLGSYGLLSPTLRATFQQGPDAVFELVIGDAVEVDQETCHYVTDGTGVYTVRDSGLSAFLEIPWDDFVAQGEAAPDSSVAGAMGD